MATWPATAHELTQLQQALGEMNQGRWQPPTTVLRIGACFVCFQRVQAAGAAGDRGFAGAAVTYRRRRLAGVTCSGPAGGPYLPALLALREGPLLEGVQLLMKAPPDLAHQPNLPCCRPLSRAVHRDSLQRRLNAGAHPGDRSALPRSDHA
jgi:hypothetical protein